MKVKIHMKSGKTIHIHCVKSISYKYNGNTITSIEVERSWYSRFVMKMGVYYEVMVSSIDLANIEGITYKTFLGL